MYIKNTSNVTIAAPWIPGKFGQLAPGKASLIRLTLLEALQDKMFLILSGLATPAGERELKPLSNGRVAARIRHPWGNVTYSDGPIGERNYVTFPTSYNCSDDERGKVYPTRKIEIFLDRAEFALIDAFGFKYPEEGTSLDPLFWPLYPRCDGDEVNIRLSEDFGKDGEGDEGDEGNEGDEGDEDVEVGGGAGENDAKEPVDPVKVENVDKVDYDVSVKSDISANDNKVDGVDSGVTGEPGPEGEDGIDVVDIVNEVDATKGDDGRDWVEDSDEEATDTPDTPDTPDTLEGLSLADLNKEDVDGPEDKPKRKGRKSKSK